MILGRFGQVWWDIFGGFFGCSLEDVETYTLQMQLLKMTAFFQRNLHGTRVFAIPTNSEKSVRFWMKNLRKSNKNKFRSRSRVRYHFAQHFRSILVRFWNPETFKKSISSWEIKQVCNFRFLPLGYRPRKTSKMKPKNIWKLDKKRMLKNEMFVTAHSSFRDRNDHYFDVNHISDTRVEFSIKYI